MPSIATVAAVASIASTGLSMVGSIMKGEAEKQAADYNAVIARQNAVNATLAGQARAEDVSLKGAAEGGRIKAAYAANNITINDPNPHASTTAVIAGQRAASRVDTINTMNDALIQAYGYKAQASLDKSQGQAAQVGGYLGAAGDLAQGVSSWGGDLTSPDSGGSPLSSALQITAQPGLESPGVSDLPPLVTG